VISSSKSILGARVGQQSFDTSMPVSQRAALGPPPTDWLATLLAIDAALARTATRVEAGRAVLAQLGEAGGWAAANLYRIDDALGELRCEEHWAPLSAPAPEIESISRRTWFPRGEGLPGEAWACAGVRWIPDLAAHPAFHRAFWTTRDGLRSACAFPLIAGAEIVGVIELFGRTPRAPDPALTVILGAAGARLGDALKRRALEDALERAEDRLFRVVSHAPIVLFAFDAEGRFTMGEGRGLVALGLAAGSFVGRSIFDVYRDAPQVLDHARAALRGEAFTAQVHLDAGHEYETRYTPLRGPDGAVVEVIGVAIDITDRRRAEAALKQSEARLVDADRLASLGTLAAGVAHEINNPLSYVLLNLDLVLRELDTRASGAASAVPRGDLVTRLREARLGVDRVRLIVQDLKAFSRVDTERRGPVDVRSVLDETIELCSNEIRHRARLVRDFADVPRVEANASRLGQVFLNLLLNAGQSIAEGDVEHNQITVATSVDARGRVVVAVSDTGAGIPEDILTHVFEPFFTTKPSGVGTGLGLSICHGIVTALGGEITVESRIGQGSVFRVILPGAAPIDSIRAATRPESLASIPPPRTPRGRVLVVDDEPVLAAALGRSLAPEFEVEVLNNGREALERLRRDPPFDAVLCDLIMPEMTGMDVYEALKDTDPDLTSRIIFMTGGTFTRRARDFLASIPNPALDKPFDLTMLEALLRTRTEGEHA
jgi:signal transduction histidine kinase/CheY-like chemotaxis protein